MKRFLAAAVRGARPCRGPARLSPGPDRTRSLRSSRRSRRGRRSRRTRTRTTPGASPDRDRPRVSGRASVRATTTSATSPSGGDRRSIGDTPSATAMAKTTASTSSSNRSRSERIRAANVPSDPSAEASPCRTRCRSAPSHPSPGRPPVNRRVEAPADRPARRHGRVGPVGRPDPPAHRVDRGETLIAQRGNVHAVHETYVAIRTPSSTVGSSTRSPARPPRSTATPTCRTTATAGSAAADRRRRRDRARPNSRSGIRPCRSVPSAPLVVSPSLRRSSFTSADEADDRGSNGPMR